LEYLFLRQAARPPQKEKNMKRKHDCPFCKPDKANQFDPWREAQCVLNKPLMMVIPPGGVHLECPVHPEGHHVFGSPLVYCQDSSRKFADYEHDPSKDLTYDSTRPYGTTTGSTIHDTFKFSM
jgi:hypothetical protein